jgi:Putative polyhydroxyalkanoic acid system protein (PHA_gran_rgn)
MSKPLIVSIPHNLGRQEAVRRLQGGMGQLKSQFAGHIGVVEETWTGDRMDFRVGALGQTVTGNLEVTDDTVQLEVYLPWVMAMIAEKAKSFIQKQGTLMLEKK